MKPLVRAVSLALLLFTGTARADMSAEEREFLDSLDLDYREGLVTLPTAHASLDVTEAFRFLDQQDARAVLEDYWGNPEDDTVIGMLVPAATPIGEEGNWGVVLSYSGDGYVSDEDASEIDYDELLEEMQQATRDSNEYLAEAGYPTSELVGWAKPPRYDAVGKRLHWAQHIQFADTEGGTLNYDIRVLGREGYLSMMAVADMDDLALVDAAMDDVLGMAKFDPGMTYADFDEETDRTAEYGIAALVGGGLAAKSGLLAKLGLLFAKGWKLLLVGGVALAAVGKKLFGKKDPAAVS